MSTFGLSAQNSSNNSWGASAGFGKSSSFSGLSNATTTGGPNLFANSSTNNTASNSSNLFGNSSDNNNQREKRPALGGANSLFGISNTQQSTASSEPGQLFGSSNPNSNSNPNTSSGGGLFGGSMNSNANPNPGLSLNTNSSTGGLFGGMNSNNNNNNNNTNSGGLFGNSSNDSKGTTGGGLFGGSNNNSFAPSTSGLFGNSRSNNQGNLSANSSINNQGGIFGGSSGTNSGLFSNPSNSNTQSSGAFGGAVNVNNNNPYNYDKVFNDIQRDEANMPQSITESLFANSSDRKTSDRKVYSSKPSALPAPKSSLLTKLGQTFRIFRSNPTNNGASYPGFSTIKGLFTQPNFINSKKNLSFISKASSTITNRKINKKSFRSPGYGRNLGDMKKLVIKSKPLRFHLINADKVFNSKKRRIQTDIISSNKILTNANSSDDDMSDFENELTESKRTSHHVGVSKDSKDDDKNEKIQGESYLGEIIDENDPDNLDFNDGYWCRPSIKELNKLSIEELEVVENFIIGRVGFGQVTYNFPVDLSGVYMTAEENESSIHEELFNKIFIFSKSKVLVYKDLPKPPISFGLNVPATITLVAPCPKSRQLNAHIKKLQNITGCEFLTYDPITFQWVFKVKHFSVWGLIDDEDVDDDEYSKDERQKLIELKKRQDEQEIEASVEYSKVYESDKFQQEIKRQKLGKSVAGLPGAWNFDTTLGENPFDVKKHLIEDEINNQISLYKRDQTQEIIPDYVSEITVDSEEESQRSASPVSLVFGEPDNDQQMPEEKRNFDYLKLLVSALPPNVGMDELVNEKAYEPEISNDAVFDNVQSKPNLPVSNDWLIQLEFANDLNSSLSPYTASQREHNHSLNLERVDNILFSSFNQRATSGNESSTPIKKTFRTNVIEGIDELDYDESNPLDVSKIIFVLLSKAKVKTRFNKYPISESSFDISFNDLLIEYSDDVQDDQLIKLGSVLFDDVSLENFEKYSKADLSNFNLVSYLSKVSHKEVLVNWLKEFNKHSIETSIQQSTSNILEIIFLQICASDLKGAISTSINSNNSHLSVLLTLLDSHDDAVKSIAKSQLNYWGKTSSINYIPKPIIKIHKILSGDFEDVLSELPWNIALLLQLCYGNNSLELHEVIKDLPGVSSDNAPFVDLLKIYFEQHVNGPEKALKLLENSSMNVKLKWIIHKVLNKDLDSFKTYNDIISVKFGKYLEKKNLWKEAIFVYSHHSNDNQAETLIRNVVISNVDNFKITQSNIDEEEYLTQVLKVPHSLIYEAIAIQKHSIGDYWQEGEAYVTARLWEKAHSTIVEELGPSTIISNSLHSKNHLLKIIAQFPQNGLIIPTWKQGAGVYAAYFKLNDQFGNHEDIDIQELDNLLINISLIKAEPAFKSQAALKLMSKKVGDITLTYKSQISDVKNKIMALKLGENEQVYFSVRL